MSNQRLSDIDKEIANISGQNLVLIRLQSKGCINSALALSQADELGRRLRDLRRLRRKVLEAADGDKQIQTTEAMLDYLDGVQWQAKVTPGLFENLVERITVVSADEVRFRCLKGLELTDFLETVKERCRFSKWFCGHYHVNRVIDERFVIQWEQISQVE